MDNDLTPSTIDQLMEGPIPHYQPMPLEGVISPSFEHQEAAGARIMDTEFVVGLLGIISVVGGFLWWAYKMLIKDKFDAMQSQISDQRADFDKRLKPVENLPGVIEGLVRTITDKVDNVARSVGDQMDHITDLMETHVENSNKQIDVLREDIRDITRQSRRNS